MAVYENGRCKWSGNDQMAFVLQLKSLWSPWLPPGKMAALQKAVGLAQTVKLRGQVIDG